MPQIQRERRKQLVLAGLLFFQLILVSIQVPRGEESSYFERGIFFIFAPIQRGIHAVFEKMGSVWRRYADLRNVEKQNREMRDELFRLRQENIQLRNGLEKSTDKQAIARILADLRASFLFASVIGADASNLYKSIIIDKGARDGVTNSMAVVDKYGNLVGRTISPVSLGETTVQLLTDDNSGISVHSKNHRVAGVLAGDGKSGTCWLKYVPATNTDLAVGEELITSALDRVFPAGIRAGRVISIVTDNSLFKRIAVRPFLDFGDLNFVAVLTQKLDTLF
jgi:rod shape-determining protein MreC